jgi:hypothetical protein
MTGALLRDRVLMWSLLMGLGSFVFFASSWAGVIHVPEDQPSVLAALDLAVSGDTVLVAPGVWTDKEARYVWIGGELELVVVCGILRGGVALIGQSGPEATIIDAQDPGTSNVCGLVYVNADEGSSIENLSLVRANDAVIAVEAASIELHNCVIRDNSQALSLNACDLSLFDCVIRENADPERAVRARHTDSARIERCRFESNVGRAADLGPIESLTIHDCEFIEHSPSAGGAVQVGECSVDIRGNLFLRNAIVGPEAACGGGLGVGRSSGSIRFNTFAYDSALGFSWGGGLGLSEFWGEVSNNTFYGCHSERHGHGGCLYLGGCTVTVGENLITDATGHEAVTIAANTFNPASGCNLYWNNLGGDIFNGDPFPTDIWADPLYCDPENLDFTLAANSPCLPGATPGCGQIGAWGQGCGGVTIKATSWGRIKSLYR